MTVFEAARQVDCIQAAERLGLQLKRSGSRCFTRYLFHAENTPSMCLYPDTGGFYCFGCQEHGDAIRLYQQELGVSALEAAKRLCQDFGLSCDTRKRNKKNHLLMPNPLPRVDARTLAKRLTEYRENVANGLISRIRRAEQQMEVLESRLLAQDYAYDDIFQDSEWQGLLKEKSDAQESLSALDGLTLSELLEYMKEGQNGRYRTA